MDYSILIDLADRYSEKDEYYQLDEPCPMCNTNSIIWDIWDLDDPNRLPFFCSNCGHSGYMAEDVC